MGAMIQVAIFLVLGAFALLSSAIKIMREYERGIVFRLGRYVGVKGPGIVFLIPMVRDSMAQPQAVFITLKDLGATDYEAIRHGSLPMALPRIWDAMTVAVSIQWTYITVAEFVNAKSGLGTMIQNSKRFSSMEQVFAGIFVIIGLALITNLVLVGLKRKLFPWETE